MDKEESGNGKKEFIKRLRKNSKRYRKTVLTRSSYSCELCGWESLVSECMHIHHICPISMYSKLDLYHARGFNLGIPDEKFELANQIVLCPNCHAIVHSLIRHLDIFEKYNYFSDRIFEEFLKHADFGIHGISAVQKLKDISTGMLLKLRLSDNEHIRRMSWKN